MTGRPLALVVEDAPDQAALLRRYLDREGFDVFIAHDAESAIAAFPDIDPVVAVLDLLLPGISGQACARLVQEAIPRLLPRDQLGARCRRLPAGGCRAAETDHGRRPARHRRKGATMRATPLGRAENRWYQVFDNPSPLLKQAPTVIATIIAAILTWWVPDLPITHVMPAVWQGSPSSSRPPCSPPVLTTRGMHDGWAVLLIPIVDIVGLGLFRTGTGGATSLFSSLVLLPVVWLAAAPGIRWVFVVGGLTSIALLMPYFTNPPDTSVEWLRGVVGPLVFSAVAAVINQLSRQQRMRVDQAEELVVERTRALSENVAMIVQLRDKERQYRELLDSFESQWASITAQAVIATDCSGKITAWNPGAERLLGLSAEEARGRRAHRPLLLDGGPVDAGRRQRRPSRLGPRASARLCGALARNPGAVLAG